MEWKVRRRMQETDYHCTEGERERLTKRSQGKNIRFSSTWPDTVAALGRYTKGSASFLPSTVTLWLRIPMNEKYLIGGPGQAVQLPLERVIGNWKRGESRRPGRYGSNWENK